jgi:hypothetical protein
LAEIDARLRAAETSGFGELALGDSTVMPTRGTPWSLLHAKGYAPTTTLEAQPDAGARLPCGTHGSITHGAR